jgi:metal-dependent amidase/aminoacylase/carboxypeptidase family protein
VEGKVGNLFFLAVWAQTDNTTLRFAHDTLTKFMSEHGFKITKHYLGLDTAWRAEFTNGNGGRVLGVNSEMDALPGIGHGCGHNLIAVSGVGVAIAVKAALIAHNVSGKVVLLGTPGNCSLKPVVPSRVSSPHLCS